jgi:NAD(P)-dependent dehydrogenase (short-subunit alcohol dehydrogenase family)
MNGENRMAITLDLKRWEETELKALASQLNVSAEALAEAAVRDLLARSDDESMRTAQAIAERTRKVDVLGRDAALGRLRAGIDSMDFRSSGRLPSRDERHDRE